MTNAPVGYTHEFHSATSLRLILGIIPRLPRWLVPPLGIVTATLFVILLPRERRAAAANQARILGVRGWRLARAVWRQFYAFSRLMVSHVDLTRLSTADLERRLSSDAVSHDRLRQALAAGHGVVVLTAHLGNWEVGVRFLERFGAPVSMVMHADRGSAAERWLMQRRRSTRVEVLRIGDQPLAMAKVLSALGRNGIVAMQGDRPFGRHVHRATLFGAPFAVPLGPFRLAALCGAPVLPAFVTQDGWWRWRAEVGPPLLAGGGSGTAQTAMSRGPETSPRPATDALLAAAAAGYAAALEEVVRRHPDQWFQFYEVWRAPGPGGGAGGSDLEPGVAHEDHGVAVR